jgi:dihydrofolate reductase
MSLVVSDITITLDGFGSGEGQSLEHPFGHLDPDVLHAWMFDEATAAESAAERAAIVDAGAFIMGRNMFDPGRGDWNLDWTGWWGPEPPYHGPVFVLAHRPRADLVMEGGTTFHFVTDGIHSALDAARAAAGDRNVAIAGGPSTLNQYLAAGLVDELRLHVSPIVAGRGERVFDGVDTQRWQLVSARPVALATHTVYRPIR